MSIIISKDVCDRIFVNRCQCEYCKELYFSREYLNAVDWRVFECLRDQYLQPQDILKLISRFSFQTLLFIKKVMNERIKMMESGYSVFAEEIESLDTISKDINCRNNNHSTLYQKILVNQL